MSYVTAMLRARARSAMEEARHWRHEAEHSQRFVERRMFVLRDFDHFLCANSPAPDVAVTTRQLRVEEGAPWAMQFARSDTDVLPMLVRGLTAMFEKCVEQRQFPYRATVRSDPFGERHTLTIHSLRIPPEPR